MQKQIVEENKQLCNFNRYDADILMNQTAKKIRHPQSTAVKSERTLQYFKDRTEHFDDYYPCMRFDCDLSHVYKWLCLFVFMRNAMIANIKFSTLRYIIGGGETN